MVLTQRVMLKADRESSTLTSRASEGLIVSIDSLIIMCSQALANKVPSSLTSKTLVGLILSLDYLNK